MRSFFNHRETATSVSRRRGLTAHGGSGHQEDHGIFAGKVQSTRPAADTRNFSWVTRVAGSACSLPSIFESVPLIPRSGTDRPLVAAPRNCLNLFNTLLLRRSSSAHLTAASGR